MNYTDEEVKTAIEQFITLYIAVHVTVYVCVYIKLAEDLKNNSASSIEASPTHNLPQVNVDTWLELD